MQGRARYRFFSSSLLSTIARQTDPDPVLQLIAGNRFHELMQLGLNHAEIVS